MLFFNSPTLLLASSLASALAQTSYGSNNDTKPGSNDSLANAPYSTCQAFYVRCGLDRKLSLKSHSFIMYTFLSSTSVKHSRMGALDVNNKI